MERAEVLAWLLDLAREAGLTVREAAAGEGLRSGGCRVRGEHWLVISAADPLEDRIEAAVAALRAHAPAALEGRFLPPAVRARLGE